MKLFDEHGNQVGNGNEHLVYAEQQRLRAALAFYADPDSYFAIAIFPDPPCGAFYDDVSDANDWAEYGQYNRPMPGKLARETLGDPDLVWLARIEPVEDAS